MTYTIAYWQESAGEHTAWIACPRENFIAAQGATRAQARKSLIRTITATIRLHAHFGDALPIHPVPADLLHHWDGETELIDL